ncbi:NAD-dependent epimerase/dehydratase family protein [Listeria booriae]|uniref:NAD-dependent epimerase/dehydratase family protein n=1 Tax=Listeria booriae TaxID=1552123 RepID=UPI0016244A1C|nr:NAD-dependent epimerase/dehydratase family protein [Listeria booriae]MBC1889497.1 NAD-dependent epimerase/dehydratase family protein [Listeria booriae]
MKKNILVTGGAGFIGSHLVSALLQEHRVVVLDNFSTGRRSNLPENSQLTVVEGDVSDLCVISQLFADQEFDYIFHLAAIASVMESVEQPLVTHQTNMDGTIYLLNAARTQNKPIQRFVFASSAAVYGAEPTLPKTENSPIQPLTPYAIDKFGSERYVTSYSQLFQLPVAVARFFNVYGPRQNPDSPYSGVLSLLVDAFKKGTQANRVEFTVYGDGQQVRDFIYVADVIQGLRLLAFSEEARDGTFNLGTGRPISLHEVILVLEILTKKQVTISYKAAREGDIPKSYAAITKLEQLGFQVNMPIEKGLQAYLEAELCATV